MITDQDNEKMRKLYLSGQGWGESDIHFYYKNISPILVQD